MLGVEPDVPHKSAFELDYVGIKAPQFSFSRLQKADPVLGVVYPPFIAVVVLLLFHKHIACRHVYQGAAIGAFLAGVALELYSTGVLTVVPLDWLPLYSMGLGWIAFAIVGGAIGWAIGKRA